MPIPFSLNPSLAQVPTYQPGRPIEEVARDLRMNPSEFIKLASNENPLGPSPRALAAMRDSLARLHLYPDGNAFYLKEKLSGQLGVKPEQVIFGNGSNEIIEFVGHAFLNREAEVVVSEYCFAVYPMITRLFGAELVTVPAKNYGHDLPAMLAAITPRTRVVFVANPNNPTGTLATADELRDFVERVPPQVVVALDEAYIEFLPDPVNFVPRIARGELPNLILMRTFSKIYGLAGLRLGYGVAHREVIAGLEKIRQPFNINSLVQAGALAALDDQEHLQQTRANNSAGLKFFERALSELKVPFLRSYANFILLDLGDGQKMFQALQARGVITRPMGGYGLPQFIRVTIGTPEENHRCLNALREILAAEADPSHK